MLPDYEVKLMLHPERVLSGPLLKKEVTAFFSMPEPATGYSLQFLDTVDKDLSGKGWNVRLRRFEGQNEVQLTFKKRYPVIGNNLDAALAQAAFDGFDDQEKDFEAQVEWGWESKTLSLSLEKSLAVNLPGSELPGEKSSRRDAIKHASPRFDNGFAPRWGTKQLSAARVYGPVEARRYLGSWSGMKVTIEIWYLLGSSSGYPFPQAVEISFRTGSIQKAGMLQKQLMEQLKAKGWFYPEDVLKTELVLEQY